MLFADNSDMNNIGNISRSSSPNLDTIPNETTKGITADNRKVEKIKMNQE